jgi:ArsR family transcriptional regulator
VAVINLPHYFEKIGNMETLNASELLAALGHESRLSIYRLLVEAGPEGVNAGSIAEQLGIPAATASFHLSNLSRVGLIKARQESRFIYYATDYGVMDELLAFLTDKCCQGQSCLPKTESVDTTEKRRKKAGCSTSC